MVIEKLTKEQVKVVLSKTPLEVTKEELGFIFQILGFQIKEYSSSEHEISFEIHFERIYIIRVTYRNVGLMSFENEFLYLSDNCHSVCMGKAKNIDELLNIFINMFSNNILSNANYGVVYDEDSSLFDSEKEASEYLNVLQNFKEKDD